MLALTGHARAAGIDVPALNLPDLADPHAHSSAGFRLDRNQLGFGYAGREAKWGAELDGYTSAAPSLTLDYGLRMNPILGLGTRFNYRSEYAETLASGVLAPARNLRIQLTAGELRRRACVDDAACGAEAGAQNSLLLGLKRNFAGNGLLSALSYAAYSVAERGSTESLAGEDGAEGGNGTRGRMSGHVLNLKLRPTPQSTVELRHGRGALSYHAPDGVREREALAFSGVRYTRYFSNCLELRGRYSARQENRRLELDMARHRWRMSLARSDAAGDADLSLRIAYSIPLRSGSRQPRNCGTEGMAAPSFAPLTVAATGRPALFPESSLTSTGSDGIVEGMAGW